MRNAFAFAVQARPYPHLWPDRFISGVAPISITARYFSASLPIPSHDGRPAIQRLTSPANDGFHRRLSDMARSFEGQRDFNPPEQRAAQRTLQASPPAIPSVPSL